MKTLPTIRAAQLTEPETSEAAWLIEGLWSAEAVGIIGGEPKCGKSFLALDLAVAVASGTPCLRRFPARQRGVVLLYAAEDSAHIVRQRLEGIAHAAGVNFETLDIYVITVATLRLDRSRRHCGPPSPTFSRSSRSSTRSCACTASMKMSPVRSRRSSLICARCSVTITPPLLSCTMPARAPPMNVADRR